MDVIVPNLSNCILVGGVLFLCHLKCLHLDYLYVYHVLSEYFKDRL